MDKPLIKAEVISGYGKQSLPVLRLTNTETAAQCVIPITISQRGRLVKWVKAALPREVVLLTELSQPREEGKAK